MKKLIIKTQYFNAGLEPDITILDYVEDTEEYRRDLINSYSSLDTVVHGTFIKGETHTFITDWFNGWSKSSSVRIDIISYEDYIKHLRGEYESKLSALEDAVGLEEAYKNLTSDSEISKYNDFKNLIKSLNYNTIEDVKSEKNELLTSLSPKDLAKLIYTLENEYMIDFTGLTYTQTLNKLHSFPFKELRDILKI